MKRFISLLLVLSIFVLTLAHLSILTIPVGAASGTTPLNSTLYEGTDNYGYTTESSRRVSTASTGHTSLGTLSVNGDNYRVTEYNGYQAVAVTGGSLTFSYAHALKDTSYNGRTWHVGSDSLTTVAGRSVGQSIGDGALVIFKSYDGSGWTNVGVPSVNINNTTVTFTPDGSDVSKGVYYRFVSAAECYYEYTYQSDTVKKYPSYGDAPWYLHTSPAAVGIWILANGWDEPVYSTGYSYTNLAQESIVYVASDAAAVGFRSADTDGVDLSSVGMEDVSPEELKILSKGLSLRDGDTSCSYITLDMLGNTCNKVTCSYNGSTAFNAKNGQTFTDEGRYDFTVTSPFGTTRKTTLYILNPANAAYDQYFGQGLMDQSTRMYSADCPVPLYAAGTAYTILGDAFRPGVYGSILHYADEAAISSETYTVVRTFTDLHQSYTAPLTQSGYYCFDLYSGDPNSAGGQLLHWVFVIAVADSEGYIPSVNYDLLHSIFRSSSYERRVMNVAFPTAGGGSYVFVFPSDQEEEALAFSESIEKRFIETYTDTDGSTYYYYKAAGSTNGIKQRYDDIIELWAALSENARSNVSVGYIIGSEEYGSMTVDQVIENIQTTSLTHDVRVLADDSIRREMMSEEVYLNKFVFTSVADYEVSSVTLIHEDGYEYSIPFGADVSAILDRTGIYTVVERNWASERRYEAVYIHGNDNTAALTLESTVLSKCKDSYVNSMNDGMTFTAHSFSLVSASDRLDSQSLLTVVGEGFRETMLLSEVDNYVIDTVGSYELIFENRVGNQFRIHLTVEPLPILQVNFHDCELPATATTYGCMPDLPVLTREGFTFLGWFDRDGREVTPATFAAEGTVDLYPHFREIPREALVIVTDSFGGHTVYRTTIGEMFPLPAAVAIPGFAVSVTVNGILFSDQFLTVDTESIVISYTYTPIPEETEPNAPPITTPEIGSEPEIETETETEIETEAETETEIEAVADAQTPSEEPHVNIMPVVPIADTEASHETDREETVTDPATDPVSGCSAIVGTSSLLLVLMAVAVAVTFRKKQ